MPKHGIPSGVEIKRDEKSNVVTVKGPKGELKQYVDPRIELNIEDGNLHLTGSRQRGYETGCAEVAGSYEVHREKRLFSRNLIRRVMKQTVINELTTAEVKERLAVEKDNLVKMRLNHAISPLENPQLIKAQRRTIARLMTELRKRELNENK